MKNRVNKIITLLMVVALELPAMAQLDTNRQQQVGAAIPSSTFRSTCTMPSSGSNYSSTPMLNADGTATQSYESTSESSGAPSKSGPHKAPPITGGEDMPIGDGVWVLLFLAIGYVAFGKLRRRWHVVP